MSNPTDYAASLLTDARGSIRDRRKLGNNTYARRTGTAVAVRLHDTDVVTLHDDGTVTLETGGWRTVTTRDRMNRYAPGALITTSRGVMSVHVGGTTYCYVDGFTYSAATGEVLTDPAVIDAERHAHELVRKAEAAARRWIRSMTEDEARTLGDKLAASDYRGDCFYCCMTTNGLTLGDAAGSPHVAPHLAERYFVPSLIRHAVIAAGEQRTAAYWIVDMQRGDTNVPTRIVRAVADYIAPRLIAEGWPDVDVDGYPAAEAVAR